MRRAKVYSLVLVLIVTTGCASYRTNTSLDFSSADTIEMPSDFLILEGDLVDIPYTSIAPVEAIVKKLTAFHKDPTKDQVNLVLFQQAAALGADGVINVKYKSGVGFDTWGYLQANGIAVKTERDYETQIKASDTVQPNTRFMGIAAEEVASKTYDKVLWVKALSLAEGDVEKQKGIYINLRSNQLASQTLVLEKEAKTEEYSIPQINVSGTYISAVTTDKSWAFRLKSHRDTTMTLMQYGSKVTGIDLNNSLKISGTIEGDTITFYMLPNDANSQNELNGIWKVRQDGSGLEGKWTINGFGGASGDWDLRKIK